MSLFFFEFADEFFYCVLALVALLSLIDWLLGEEVRARIRERIGITWLHLGEARYGQLFVEDMRYVRSKAIMFFGTPAFSVRRLFRVFTFVLSVAICLIVILFFLLPIELAYSPFCLLDSCPSRVIVVGFDDAYPKVLSSVPTWTVSLFLSISFTIFCLKKFYSAKKPLTKLFFFLLDVLVAIALIYSQFAFYVVVHTAFLELGSLRPEDVFARNLSKFSFVLILSPTACYVLLISLRAMLKLSRPVLFPTLMLILLRFHQSKKGVLTNLAIFFGVVSKLGQQAIKVFAM